MCETMSELNFQSLMNCDQLELGSIAIDMGFHEFIPDMYQEASVVPDMTTGVLSYPASHEHFNDMPLSNALKPELCDLSTFQYAVQPEQQQPHYQQDWEAFSVPSTTTSPVQFEGMHFNTVPSGYEQQQFPQTNFVNGRKRRAVRQPCEATVDFDTAFQLGTTDQMGGKPKRRRVQNSRQRKAANVRERKRMLHLNDAFDSLKTRVPTFAYEKRLSRIETLKLAMTYISFMTQVLDGKKPDEISLGEDGLNSFSIEDLGRFKSVLTSSYVSDDTESSESGISSS